MIHLFNNIKLTLLSNSIITNGVVGFWGFGVSRAVALMRTFYESALLVSFKERLDES